ncbi:hypothetical protein VHUM_00381 [Vanrija humicola]|uniref:Phospholipase/carboxylesterase/thioesterase domain-containing protein n=1 Tax=Vanrija humicola TaxID=5417 RepID=A0A7D8Z3I4_VANHU|nr:hypothetical protein VHUM_00381 [Vanrija humicola]
MAETPITLKPAQATPSAPKPAPTRAALKPWDFEYVPAKDGKDANLLIMFHGLGDTKAPFAGLARQMSLPSTAVLSLQAPNPVPLMDNPSWSWYNTFDPMFNPLPNPDPSPTLPALRTLLAQLVGLGWRLPQIHLFGWAQGGTMALELALSVGRESVDVQLESGESVSGKRLGSVVSVCAGLESFPTGENKAATPALWFTRTDPRSVVEQRTEAALRKGFAHLEIVRGDAARGQDMPRSTAEWTGIMRFWGQVLARGDEGWKGDGEVYEVVRS